MAATQTEPWRANTTLRDLSDKDNVTQASHELERAHTDVALALWARRWGRAAIITLQDAPSEAEHDEELAEADTKFEALKERCSEWASRLEKVGEKLAESDAYDGAILQAADKALEDIRGEMVDA